MFRSIGSCVLRHWIWSTLVLVSLILTAFASYSHYHEAKQFALNLQCESNCKGIVVSILSYEEYHNHLPPAHIDAPDGSRMHSWRALMFDKWRGFSSSEFPYDYREPWNGPRNSKLGDGEARLYSYYACPSAPDSQRNHRLSNYFVVVGSNTPFPGAHTMSHVGDDIFKGRSNTILNAEAIGLDIEWLEPRDLEYDTMSFFINDPKRPSISSHHPQGPHVSMADGSVRCLDKDIDPKVLQQMLTADKDVWRENEPDFDSDGTKNKRIRQTPHNTYDTNEQEATSVGSSSSTNETPKHTHSDDNKSPQ